MTDNTLDLQNVGRQAPPANRPGPVTIALRVPNGGLKFALVDVDDFERIEAIKWRVTEKSPGHFYTQARVEGKTIGMQHFILEYSGLIDHINGDGLDNRKCNLRVATNTQNNANRTITHGTNRYRGVYRGRSGTRFVAQITVERLARHLGTFDTAEEAARAYDAAAKEAFGEFARLNFTRSS